MFKLIKWLGVATFLLIGLMQLQRPQRTNPISDETRSIENQVAVPGDVSVVLRRACNDCHSNQTAWPWYSNVAPVSWFVVDHVNHGRRHLNFSDWPDDREKAGKLLDAIDEWVEKDRMPLGSYVMIHRDASLTPQDKRMLSSWARTERVRLADRSAR